MLLEGAAGNESGERLVLLAFAEGLPPISIVLRDDVEDVALHEADAQLFTRYVQIVLGIVIKVRLQVNLNPQKNHIIQ